MCFKRRPDRLKRGATGGSRYHCYRMDRLIGRPLKMFERLPTRPRIRPPASMIERIRLTPVTAAPPATGMQRLFPSARASCQRDS